MIPLVIGAFGGFAALANQWMQARAWKEDDEIANIDGKVSIIISSLNEEKRIGPMLESLYTSNIILAKRNKFEIILSDSNSSDRTIEIARPYVDKIINAPRGKLSAKAFGVTQSSGDIILFLDSDITLAPNTINMVLKHFENPNIVAGSAVPIHTEDSLPFLKFIAPTAEVAYTFLHPIHTHGCAHAIRRWTWEAIGGYDLNIDQKDWNQVFSQEEVNFNSRIIPYGGVFRDLQAVVYMDDRRERHWLGIKSDLTDQINTGVRM